VSACVPLRLLGERAPGLHFFLNVPRIPCAVKWPLVLWQPFARRVLGSILRRCTASTPASSSFEWNHFVDRSALFTNSFRRHRDIVSAKQKRSAASLNLLEAYFTCKRTGSPLVLLTLTVEAPRCPLAGARWICIAAVLCGGMRLLP
jgi:hypothetical protein